MTVLGSAASSEGAKTVKGLFAVLLLHQPEIFFSLLHA